MATTFQSVFDKFTTIIESHKLSKLSDLQLTELLTMFLDGSVSLYFKNCKTDLSDRNSTQFNQTLTSEEQWILAYGMVMVWCESNLNSEKKLKDYISPKDYNSHSPANLLDKLIVLNKLSLKKIKELTVSYSFNGFAGFN
jgi:hypothetical protein